MAGSIFRSSVADSHWGVFQRVTPNEDDKGGRHQYIRCNDIVGCTTEEPQLMSKRQKLRRTWENDDKRDNKGDKEGSKRSDRRASVCFFNDRREEEREGYVIIVNSCSRVTLFVRLCFCLSLP